MTTMDDILDYPLNDGQAALWFLGQAGYIVRACGLTVVIDPYLSDSAAKIAPELARRFPVPLDPKSLRADLFIVTHDHGDHLDAETLNAYGHVETTTFIAPRLAARKLAGLGIPEARIAVVDVGIERRFGPVCVRGVYAVPSEAAVLDTCGYLLSFDNGRSVYHSSDTGWSELLAAAAPRTEVLLACINGKWGNLGAEQAARLAAACQATWAVPNHYDLMAVNSENPETFSFFCRDIAPAADVCILALLAPFVWPRGK